MSRKFDLEDTDWRNSDDGGVVQGTPPVEFMGSVVFFGRRGLFGSRVAETRSRRHRCPKHQLNLDPNPEGTQKNLDD